MTSALEGGGGTWKDGMNLNKSGCMKMRTSGYQEIRKVCGCHKWKAPSEAVTIRDTVPSQMSRLPVHTHTVQTCQRM